MLFLAFSSPFYAKDYQKIVSALAQKQINFQLFCYKNSIKYLNLSQDLASFIEPLSYKLTPWIKDYAPLIYLPSFTSFCPNGLTIAFEYKPFYQKRVSHVVDAFVSRLAHNYLNKSNIPVIYLPGSLDGGAIHVIPKDKKVFFIVAQGWNWEDKFAWIKSLEPFLGLEFDYYIIPIPNGDPFKHVDGILNVFPSLTHRDTFCFLSVNRKFLLFPLEELITRLGKFFQSDIQLFEFPTKIGVCNTLDFRHPTSVINAVVLPSKKAYAFLTYKPQQKLLSILEDIQFFSFLNKHGYDTLPILGENLLKMGGGLSCATYNAWFL